MTSARLRDKDESQMRYSMAFFIYVTHLTAVFDPVRRERRGEALQGRRRGMNILANGLRDLFRARD